MPQQTTNPRQLRHSGRWLTCEVAREYVGGVGYVLVTFTLEEDALGLPLASVEESGWAAAVAAGTARIAAEEGAAAIRAAAPHAEPRKALRRVRPAANSRESMFRLLHARTVLWERLTGELAEDMRHAAVGHATNQRTRSSADRTVTADEMGDAVSFVEDALHRGGYDAEVEAADAEYARRREARGAPSPAPQPQPGRRAAA